MKLKKKADSLTVIITVIKNRKYAIVTFDNGSEYMLSGDRNIDNEDLLTSLEEMLMNKHKEMLAGLNALEKNFWSLEKKIDAERQQIRNCSYESDAISVLLKRYFEKKTDSYNEQ